MSEQQKREDEAKARTKRRRRYDVTPEDFVRAWQTSGTAQEAADKLGMPKSNVLARASNYRSRGVNLKVMSKASPKRLDVGRLNEAIEPPPAAD